MKIDTTGIMGMLGFHREMKMSFIPDAMEEAIKELCREYEFKCARLADAEEVIRFYADEDNYTGNAGAPLDAPVSLVRGWDKGYKAQAYLDKYEEDK